MAKSFGGQSKYLINQEEKNYLRKKRLAAAGLLVLALLFLAVNQLLPLVSNTTAFIIITVFLVVIAVIEGLSKDSEQQESNFYHGRSGEGAVFYKLKHLLDDFVFFQDIKIGYGNVDFVVLGPTGLYSVEVKSHGGRIEYNGTELTRNGYIFQEKNILKQALGEALELQDYLKQKLNEDIFVTPVLVFSSRQAFVEVKNPVTNIYVLHKSYLNRFIMNNQKTFTPEKITKIETVLKELVK